MTCLSMPATATPSTPPASTPTPINSASNTRRFKDLKLRAGYNRAVRAPSVGDLFSPAVIGAGGTADPCWGPVVGGTGGTTGTIQGHDFAYCARTGVTAAEWGNITTNPAAQINTSVGGNINLKPEIADTFTYGFVFQPTFVPNLVGVTGFLLHPHPEHD